MSKSGALRLRDVRAAFRLIGECRDLGADSEQWHRRMFEGLRPLLGVRVVNGGECRWPLPHGPVEIIQALDIGFEAKERAVFMEFMLTRGPAKTPHFVPFGKVSGPMITRSRRQLVTDRDWYYSEFFNEYQKASGIDHCVVSRFQLDSNSETDFISLHRNTGEPDFSPRELRLLHLFHVELGRLIGPNLARASALDLRSLSPRLRQTLACLMEGDTEKQVAARLGLSIPTVHQYVTSLYRHFGVHSRAELLAIFIKRFRPGMNQPGPTDEEAQVD